MPGGHKGFHALDEWWRMSGVNGCEGTGWGCVNGEKGGPTGGGPEGGCEVGARGGQRGGGPEGSCEDGNQGEPTRGRTGRWEWSTGYRGMFGV